MDRSFTPINIAQQGNTLTKYIMYTSLSSFLSIYEDYNYRLNNGILVLVELFLLFIYLFYLHHSLLCYLLTHFIHTYSYVTQTSSGTISTIYELYRADEIEGPIYLDLYPHTITSRQAHKEHALPVCIYNVNMVL